MLATHEHAGIFIVPYLLWVVAFYNYCKEYSGLILTIFQKNVSLQKFTTLVQIKWLYKFDIA